VSGRAWRPRWRVLVGLGVLAVLVWRLGAGPFVDGLRTVDAQALAVGLALGLPATACAAARWRVVALGLGVGLRLPVAVAASYRAQFLNTTLPGGILGDVHRGARHGHDVGDVGMGLRAVAWERFAGQSVQLLLTVVALTLLPSPADPLVLLGLATAAVVVGLLALRGMRAGRSGAARIARAVLADLRMLSSGRTWPVIAVASAFAVSLHVAAFVVAARTAGVDAPATTLLPLALLVLMAMSIPANVAGWGPREGVAAWAFASAGLGAGAGVATAVVYGVMAFAAGLPGAALLVVGPASSRTTSTRDGVPLEGVSHG